MTVKISDKYAAILDAAETAFAQYGYHSTQMSRIAAEAGVAAGTVYLYFKNKPDVLVSLFRDRLTRLVDDARQACAEAVGPGDKLLLFIRQHLQVLGRHRDLAMITQIELRQADLEVRHQINQLMKEYFRVIDEIIAEGQEAGLFHSSVDRRQIRNMIFGTLDQTVTAWVLSGNRFDLEAQAEPTFALLLGGITRSTERFD